MIYVYYITREATYSLFSPSPLQYIYEANFALAVPVDVSTLSRPKYDFTRRRWAKYARVVKLTAFP